MATGRNPAQRDLGKYAGGKYIGGNTALWKYADVEENMRAWKYAGVEVCRRGGVNAVAIESHAGSRLARTMIAVLVRIRRCPG